MLPRSLALTITHEPRRVLLTQGEAALGMSTRASFNQYAIVLSAILSQGSIAFCGVGERAGPVLRESRSIHLMILSRDLGI
jgi:hypothetical protein